MTPPPSYHSFDGLWTDQASGLGAPCGKEARNRNRAAAERGIMPRHHTSGHEEVTSNHRSRHDRRKHHRPSRSSSHNRTWTAKLVFQGLRCNLLGSGNAAQSSRDSKGRTRVSPMTKLDVCSKNRDIHYTIHNHWHKSSPSDHVSRTKTWPDSEPTSHSSYEAADYMNGALPDFRYDANTAAYKFAQWPFCQEHSTSFDDFGSGFNPRISEELDQSSVWEKSCARWPRHPPHGAACPNSAQDPCWSRHQEANPRWDDGKMNEWGRRWPCPEFTTARDPSQQNRPSDHEREGQRYPSHPPNSEHVSLDAPSALADYNKRWNYIDTVQQPYPHELPWPAIRPDVPFDHMKCDVFSFFAQACGLQPDRGKAPKLDFQLTPRSPYPSCDQRQQERERKMLKMFKQQMQREKLRWHEDKLRRKFPEVVGKGGDGVRNDERRKAVWAGIAEGSAVCDKRLVNLRTM